MHIAGSFKAARSTGAVSCSASGISDPGLGLIRIGVGDRRAFHADFLMAHGGGLLLLFGDHVLA